MKIYLCDDNPVIVEKYSGMIQEISDDNQLGLEISLFSGGEQLIFELTDHPNEPDVIFLDILMGSMNGIETAKKIRKLHCQAEIIFLTSSEEYVFDSFGSSPLQYLIKETTDKEKLEKAILKARDVIQEKKKDILLCGSDSEQRNIPIHDIYYIEIFKRIVTVHFTEGEFSFYDSLERIEDELDSKSFVRVHRSYLINLKYLDQIAKDEITLTTGDVIPLGVTYAKKVKLAFSKFLTYNI